MPTSNQIKVIYCSWSKFKKEEWEIAKDTLDLVAKPSHKLGQLFEFEFRDVPTTEPLLCDLDSMVRFKAQSAYRAVRVPCIGEHAGLLLEGYEAKSFPGGLTQPMWDALGAELFVASCAPLASRATARAVVGYCDGLGIKTFIGETTGSLSRNPRGRREFYWDTIFCPDGFGDKTYAEIVEYKGLVEKLQVSQSIKALQNFMTYRLAMSPLFSPLYRSWSHRWPIAEETKCNFVQSTAKCFHTE
jgi:inosine/xanthosine triphosphate pyrophosphatase family protein